MSIPFTEQQHSKPYPIITASDDPLCDCKEWTLQGPWIVTSILHTERRCGRFLNIQARTLIFAGHEVWRLSVDWPDGSKSDIEARLP